MDRVLGIEPASGEFVRRSVREDRKFTDLIENSELGSVTKLDYFAIKLSEKSPFIFCAGIVSWLYLIPYGILKLIGGI